MNKKQLFDYISEKQGFINTYQSEFGNQSWWYSNRSPETCNNVKIYTYLDTEKVLELLSEKQRKQIELLDLNIVSLCNDIVWGGDYDFQYSTIGMHVTDEIDNIKNNYPAVQDITFHGRSGGWVCVVYDFNIKTGDGWTIDDIVNSGIDGTDYKTLLDIYKQINKAIETVDSVNEYIQESKRVLEGLIENPENYIYDIEQNIEQAIENLNEQEQDAKTILQALHVIENTYA